jgi:small subunit ribosomal protein S6
MTTHTNFYESLLLLNPTIEEESKTKIFDRIESLIKEENGKIVKRDDWGVRKLAYPVKKNENGLYVLLYFKANSPVQKKLDEYYRVTPDVWRDMTLKLDHKMMGKTFSQDIINEFNKKTEE